MDQYYKQNARKFINNMLNNNTLENNISSLRKKILLDNVNVENKIYFSLKEKFSNVNNGIKLIKTSKNMINKTNSGFKIISKNKNETLDKYYNFIKQVNMTNNNINLTIQHLKIIMDIKNEIVKIDKFMKFFDCNNNDQKYYLLDKINNISDKKNSYMIQLVIILN